MRTRTRRERVEKEASPVSVAKSDGPGALADAAADGTPVKALEDLRVEEVSVVTAGANLRPFLIVKSAAGLVSVQKTLMAIPGITECADKLGALGAVMTLIANAERPSEVQAILDALTPVVEKVGNLAGSNEASASSELDELLGLDHLDARIAMAETKLEGMRRRRAKTAEIDEVETRLRTLRMAKTEIVRKLDPSIAQATQLVQQALQLLQQAAGGQQPGQQAPGQTPEQAAAAAAAQAQLAATPKSAEPTAKAEPPSAEQTAAAEAAAATTPPATPEEVAKAAGAKNRPAAPASRPEDDGDAARVQKTQRRGGSSLSWAM